MMIFLLVVATVAAPVVAIVFAEYWRARKRAKRATPATAPQKHGGWVDKVIKDFQEPPSDEKIDRAQASYRQSQGKKP